MHLIETLCPQWFNLSVQKQPFENFLRRIFHTNFFFYVAELPYGEISKGEISLRKKILATNFLLTVKIECGEISNGEISYCENS